VAALDKTCFWTGAGVSADLPSALPLGDELTELIVSRVCSEEVWRQVKEDFRIAEMRTTSGRRKEAPRLEWVTEHLCRVVGDAALRPFTAFCDAPPNDLHRLFASHLAKGGRHITLNFDRCIESALGPAASLGAPVHLHGTLGPNDLGDLRTRTLELTNGLLEAHEVQVLDALRSCNRLVILGYSGRDFFDVDPFFRALGRDARLSLDHLEVEWIEHQGDEDDPTPIEWRDAGAIDGRPILRALEALGASVTYLRGSTRAYLIRLAAEWGLPAPCAVIPPSSGARRRALEEAGRRVGVERPERLKATMAFWFSMGAGKRIVELDRRLATTPEDRQVQVETLDLRRVGLQSVGRYREALRLARQLPEPVLRNGAVASLHRLRGSYLQALPYSLRALALCAGPCSPDPSYGDHCGDAMEGYVAWYRAARSSPLGRLIALGRRAIVAVARALRLRSFSRLDPVLVFEEFRDCHPYLVAHPHAVEQISRAWREVPEFQAAGPLPTSVLDRQGEPSSVFVETDHFLGYLNSERAALGRRLTAGNHRDPRSAMSLRIEFGKHRRKAATQGDLPGELKAVLLERAAGMTGAPFPVAAMREVGWNRRTKALWLVRWLRRVA
jgi:hypothetical protein